MAKKKTTDSEQEVSCREDIIGNIVDDIRSVCGKESILSLSGKIEKISVIPTGILPLDVILGVGGIPKGRVCEFFGTEGGGKTTVALHAAAGCQKNGGIAAFIDVEQTFDPTLAKACGVNLKELIVSQPEDAEQAFTVLERLMESKKVDLAIVDSVAALITESDSQKGLGDISAGRVGEQAKMMSDVLRRINPKCARSGMTIIFINQLRSQINTGYSHGPSENTPGGRALKFYSSIRLDIRKIKTLKKGDDVIGHDMVIKVVKNKVAPPFRQACVSLIYGKGIPEDITYVDMALYFKIFKQKGPWISYKDETIGQGKEAVAEKLRTSAEFKEEIRTLIMEEVFKRNNMADEWSETSSDTSFEDSEIDSETDAENNTSEENED